MNVPSYEFLAFAAVVALLINVSSHPLWRRGIIATANLAFVFSFTTNAKSLAPFACMLVIGFFAMKLVERYKNQWAYLSIVAAAVVAFCWLKHYSFIPSATFLPFAYWTVGMSYVFFRVLHLIIDAAQDSLPDRVGPVAYASYTLNFLCLVSGPIQFYQDYRETEVEAPLPFDLALVVEASKRVVWGFFKVAVLSTYCWYLLNVFISRLHAADPLSRPLFGALVLLSFPVYLYFNFSGYTDFVIGVGRFMRLRLPENFDKPFASRNFLDFWGHWHMTLSNWLKTYVYSPLLLNLMRSFPQKAVQPFLGVLSYFVTFFLVGLWHGQTKEFLFFGLLQGGGVSVVKLYQIEMTRRLGRNGYRALCENEVYTALSRGLTFTWFGFTLLWFWSTWGRIGEFAHVLGLGGVIAALAIAVACASIVLWLPQIGRASRDLAIFSTPYATTAIYAGLVVLLFSITVILNAPAPHIVYKAF